MNAVASSGGMASENLVDQPNLTEPAVGIKDIAKKLGVSPGTVSRALNNRYGVNPDTRERILKEARRQSYTPNTFARHLKDHPSLQVGVVFAPFFSKDKQVNPRAWQLIENFHARASDENIKSNVIMFSSEEDLKDQLYSHRMDVVIFYGEFSDSTFQVAHDCGVPAVVLHHRTPFKDQVSVLVETQKAASRAVEYLVALGHERLALVTGPQFIMHTAGFREGFLETLDELRIPRQNRWLVELSPSMANPMGVETSLAPLLTARHRPSAILCSSDWMAVGAFHACRRLGLEVAKDISILGHDNLPIGSELTPPLSTFDVSIPSLVQTLIHIVIDLGNRRISLSSQAHREIFLIPELIKRGSCHSLREVLAGEAPLEA